MLFGLPGAYTPTCSARHLPGFVEGNKIGCLKRLKDDILQTDSEKIKQLGVDTIACISVNDPFVMHHWGKEHNADGKVLLLADGDASFTRKMGLQKDTGEFGGVRSKRFLAHVNNGGVTHFAIDEDGKFEVSSSESSLSFISSSLASM